jgi:drug/metabolite transporter (DMT)-like permease
VEKPLYASEHGGAVRSGIRPWLALVTTQFAFASLAPSGKYAVDRLDPLLVAGLRVLVGGAILSIIALSVAREPLERRHWLPLIGLSFLGIVFNQILFLEGLQRTSASNGAILVAMIPVFTLALAILLRRERATARRVAGVAAAFAGLAVMLRIEDFRLDSQTTLGNLMIVLNTLSYAFYLVLSRPLLARYRSTTVVMWTFLFSAVVMAPLGAATGTQVEWSALDGRLWFALAWVILVGSVAAYSLNNYALKRLSPSTVASFVFLQPVIGVLLSVLILGESVALRSLLGGLGIVAGVFIVSRSEPRAVGATDVGAPTMRRPAEELKEDGDGDGHA